MGRLRSVAGLCALVLLTGCMTTIPPTAPLDSGNSAELEFVKGHESAGLGHAGGEYYTICVTTACTERRFFVSLTWINPDSVVRRVQSGEVIVSANTMNAEVYTQKTCDFIVKFDVDAGHAYMVQILNHFGDAGCLFRVKDKATGMYLHVSKVLDRNQH